MLPVSPQRQLSKKVLYNIPYKLLQLFEPVEKYLCFKRHVGPIVQKRLIVNTSLMRTKTDVVLHKTVHSIHPARATIYISWEVHTPPYQIQRRQNSRTWIETRYDYVAALMSEKREKQEITSTVRKRTGKEIQRLKLSSVTAWKNNTKVHREGEKNVQYLTNVFTGFLNFNKNCSRNPPLKKSYIYILYICI